MGVKRAGRTRGAAITASLAAHGLILGILVWRIGTAPQLAEPDVMQVQLVTRAPPDVTRHIPPPGRRAPPGAPVLPPVLSHPADAAPAAASPAPAPPDAEGQGAVRQALRGLLGCDHPALTREERERCHDRMAAGLQAGPAWLNLDPAGRYLADPTPYLNRRAHNGCKARAAGDRGPMGNEGAAAGVACAWSF